MSIEELKEIGFPREFREGTFQKEREKETIIWKNKLNGDSYKNTADSQFSLKVIARLNTT